MVIYQGNAIGASHFQCIMMIKVKSVRSHKKSYPSYYQLLMFKPTEDGEPPLARAKDWLQFETPDGTMTRANTMPQWAGSCWYYLRYMVQNSDAIFI